MYIYILIFICILVREYIKMNGLRSFIFSSPLDIPRSCLRPRRVNVSSWRLQILKNGTRNSHVQGSYTNTRLITCPGKESQICTASSSRSRRSTAIAQVGKEGRREGGTEGGRGGILVVMLRVSSLISMNIISLACPSTAHPPFSPFLTAIEDVVVGKRRGQYEEALSADPLDYDTWFDYTRLEEGQGDLPSIREVYERAIANVPPVAEKRFWRRYIYLWVKYALFEELQAGEKERAREVYRACLSVIPHKLFTFGKIWVMAAHLEVCLCLVVPTLPLFFSSFPPSLPPFLTTAVTIDCQLHRIISSPLHPPSLPFPLPPSLGPSKRPARRAEALWTSHRSVSRERVTLQGLHPAGAAIRRGKRDMHIFECSTGYNIQIQKSNHINHSHTPTHTHTQYMYDNIHAG